VRPWIQLRREVGAYHALINEGAGTGGSKRFQNFVRMNQEDFEELLQTLIKPANYTTTLIVTDNMTCNSYH
jgi:hypothetical protein